MSSPGGESAKLAGAPATWGADEDRAPRHCFISWAYLNAGSNTAHYEYCNELSRAGHRVTLIARGGGGTYWENDRFLVRLVPPTRFGEKLSHIAFAATVLRHLARESYDFVEAFFCPGVSLYPLLLFWKRTRWVLHIRTSNTTFGLAGVLKNVMGRVEAATYDGVTIIDKGIAANLYYSCSAAARLLELPLGVSPRSFVRHADSRLRLLGSRALEQTVLIYVGRMDRTRRLAALLEAYRLVLERYPDLLLVMVGDGEDRPPLEAAARQTLPPKSVLFTGAVPYEAVPDYIGAADIGLTYVPATKTYDHQPALKALEYMQMGLPQVATGTSANEKVIVDGINGVLAGDDAAGFAEGLSRLLADSALRRSIADQCRVGIERHYWGTIVTDILIPYYEGLGGGRQARKEGSGEARS